MSKLPQVDDFISATASADTGTTVRTTADLNRQLGDSSALRLNAMWQDGEVVGRDFVEQNHGGVAPAIAFGLNAATRFYLYSQHLHADNVPDGGIPSIGLRGFYNATLAAAGIMPAAVDKEIPMAVATITKKQGGHGYVAHRARLQRGPETDEQ